MRKFASVVLGALVALALFAGPAQAKRRPVCFKNPTTGQIICVVIPTRTVPFGKTVVHDGGGWLY